MRVLTATKSLEVFDILENMEGIEQKEALFTGQIRDALPDVSLVVIDFDDVVEHPYGVEVLRRHFADHEVLHVSSEEFVAQPEYWKKEAEGQGRKTFTRIPDKRVIAFASYSGGTGKTTLALDTAVHFARRTGDPVLLTEFTYGVSSLAALTGLDMPHLFDLTTMLDVEPTRWKGVTLAPMDYEYCQDLPIPQIAAYLKRESRRHVLTVVDTTWPHALVGAVRPEIDEWFVVATPRVDAAENAEKLVSELHAGRVSLVVNKKGNLGDSLALLNTERALDLPEIRQPDRFEGKLGKQVLSHTYGKAWGQYEKGFIENLRGRLGIGRDRRRSVA